MRVHFFSVLNVMLMILNSWLRRRTSQLVSGNVSYGVIPQEHWKQPDWIDEDRARDGRNRLMAQNIIYGGESCALNVILVSV